MSSVTSMLCNFFADSSSIFFEINYAESPECVQMYLLKFVAKTTCTQCGNQFGSEKLPYWNNTIH